MLKSDVLNFHENNNYKSKNSDLHLTINKITKHIPYYKNHHKEINIFKKEDDKKINDIHHNIEDKNINKQIGGSTKSSDLIVSTYAEFLNKEKEYYNLFIKNKANIISNKLPEPSTIDLESLNIINDKLYEYVYISYNAYMPTNIVSIIKKNIKNKSIYCKLNTIKNNNYFNITLYKPITFFNFYYYIEIFKKFELFNKDTKKILEVTNRPCAIEAINYLYNKYINTINNNILELLYMKKYQYLHNINIPDNTINILKQLITTLKSSVFNKYVDIDFLENNREHYKYNLIICNFIVRPQEGKFEFVDVVNTNINFYSLIFIFKNLLIDGNAIINIDNISNKAYADIYLIAKKYFKEVYLFHPKILNKFKRSGTILILKSYNGISDKDFNDLLKKAVKIIKNDPTGIDENKEFVKSFVSNSNEKDYDIIRKFNLEFYYQKNIFMDKLIELKKLSDSKKKEEQEEFKRKEDEYKKEQLIASILWAKEFDMEIIPIEQKEFDSEFGKMILKDMYSFHQPITFKFKEYSKNINNDIQIDIQSELNKLSRDYIIAGMSIDTRDIEEYDYIKQEFRFYQPRSMPKKYLGRYVENFLDYPYRTISQAWLKMYEILVNFDLFKNRKNKDILNTFHLCEAPGEFISSINHYVKSRTNIKEFNWHAQSLEKSKSNIFDDYGHIKKYPDRWDFGADKTGDINHIENIRYYGEKYIKNSDLVTSDCGLGWSPNDDSLIKVHYSEMVAILCYLRKGGNFVVKYVIPVNQPIQISVLYIMWRTFRQLAFYKPLQNTYSGEFYVIGIRYTGIDEHTKKHLMKPLKEYNKNWTFDKEYIVEFDGKKTINDYSADFGFQVVNGIEQLTNQFKNTIYRQIYYTDNYNKMGEQYIKLIHKYIDEKNKDWVKNFKPKKIPRDQQL